jgi:hypothetical protein
MFKFIQDFQTGCVIAGHYFTAVLHSSADKAGSEPDFDHVARRYKLRDRKGQSNG